MNSAPGIKKYYKQAWNSVYAISLKCKQLFVHSVKHVEFYFWKICSWSTKNSCWDFWLPCSLSWFRRFKNNVTKERFLHRVVTGDETWIDYDNSNHVIYSELLKANEMITGDRYRLKWMRLSWALKKRRPLYELTGVSLLGNA